MHSNGRLNHGEAPDRIRICRKTHVLPELHRIPGGNTPACLVSASLARAYASDLRGTVKQRMVTVLAELGLAERATSITGLSAVGTASVLAETGDPRRFATGRALVTHAGLAPREKLSGAFTGRTRLTGQGRPGLRLAAWRAVWGAQRANPVYRARYQHLTSRKQNKLTPTQAQTVIAAAILRQLHAVITTGQAWDPVTATHGTRRQTKALAA